MSSAPRRGGGEAIGRIISRLPADYSLPICIAQHLHPNDGGGYAENLNRKTALKVIVPCDKHKIRPGEIYVAPANYHMLIERDGNIALSIDEKVRWSRPSINVLFESASYAWFDRVIAIILTGANDDGTEGMAAIKAAGGLTIAQDPDSADYPVMPRAAVNAGAAEKTLTLDEITALLVEVAARHDSRIDACSDQRLA